jgi:glycosyltransferase involved in cell wall biosynthesis
MPAPTPFPLSISMVLPAFNEEENIVEAARQCLEFATKRFRAAEVIVVDDGSKDDTAKVVTELARDWPQLKLISFAQNRGYGAAIAAGFCAATSDLVFFTDADLQFDVRELADLVPLIGEADAVMGFRVYRYDSVLRCVLSWVYNRIVRVLFRVKVRDVDCSFKLFTRKVVDRLHLESTDFFIDTEMVARTRRLGFKIVEKGVRHYPRKHGHTTVRASHIPKTLWTVARMWWRIQFGPLQPPPSTNEANPAR